MKSIRQLEREHRTIEHMLDQARESIKKRDFEHIGLCLCFFQDFVDGVHNANEEQALFPEFLLGMGEFAKGPLEVMQKEHELSRAFLRVALQAFAGAARGEESEYQRFKASFENYEQILRPHIEKEEKTLFPMIERALPAKSDFELLERFSAIRTKIMPGGEYEMFVELAHDKHGSSETPQEKSTRSSRQPEARLNIRTLAQQERRGERASAKIEHPRPGGLLFDRDEHKNIWLHDFGRGLSVQANQFLIVEKDQGMILDPGGPKIYPDLYAETMLHLSSGCLRYVFLSHQDPDIGTSLNAWLLDTPADAFVSRLWTRFLPHFGLDDLLEKRLKPIPDEGMVLNLGGAELFILPAHFLHSCGNFHVYDPLSQILFSGDLGASMGGGSAFVEDFDAHVSKIAGFHRRYMASGRALKAWVKMVRTLDVKTIAPQHGPLFQGEQMVGRFLDWCETLACGVDLIEEGFRVPERPRHPTEDLKGDGASSVSIEP